MTKTSLRQWWQKKRGENTYVCTAEQMKRTTLLGYGDSQGQGKLELLIGQRVVGGRVSDTPWCSVVAWGHTGGMLVGI